MTGVVMLTAQTARSQAYAQVLQERGLRLAAAVVFGDGKPRAGAVTGPPLVPAGADLGALRLPDLSIPLDETLAAICDEVVRLLVADVNDPAVLAAVRERSPSLLIYSGYGSQIVGASLLDCAPMLHIHAGWLPEFRGSTTLYYELLAHGQCSASALLLAKTIDTGPVLARRHYPRPPAGLDMDYLYDPAIRADLLGDLLSDYARKGGLPPALAQDETSARTYYIIHPLLKHLAILGAEDNR